MKKWMVALGVLLLLLVLGLGLVYQFGGLKNYVLATREISKLSDDQRDRALQNFNGRIGENGYRGMLGYVNKIGSGGLWIWGKNGPKYFSADEYTVYSIFTGCSDQILNAKPEDGEIEVARRVYTNVSEWSRDIKNGSYVTIFLAGEGNGGNIGKIREIWAFDWWNFLPKSMGELCAK